MWGLRTAHLLDGHTSTSVWSYRSVRGLSPLCCRLCAHVAVCVPMPDCTGGHKHHQLRGARVCLYVSRCADPVYLRVRVHVCVYVCVTRMQKQNVSVCVYVSHVMQIPGLFLFWNPIFNAATWAMQGSTA